MADLLERVAAGEVAPDEAMARLTAAPCVDEGFAKVDLQRAQRRGLAEVVLGLGKTPEQLVGIAKALLAHGQRVLVTRVEPAGAEALKTIPNAVHHVVARCVTIAPHGEPATPEPRGGTVAIVTAGTSDMPVAEEARVCAEALGTRVDVIVDVGVAGLHRLLAVQDRLRAARVLIVVAGMEGALPSVVAGLVERPVIAVPTSIGYGAAFEGMAALLGMLSSCSAGVTVVNIDNGFGAAYAATAMNRLGDAGGAS
jgi:NCAIR mutase (PurE)-related protein